MMTAVKPICLRAISFGSAVHIRKAATSCAMLLDGGGGAVVVDHVVAPKRRRHRDVAAREGLVLVEDGAEFFLSDPV
jgi:hypothetical protein